MLYIFLKYTIGLLILLFLRPVIHGKNNLRVKGKAIFVANHRSLMDPILLALITPRPIHFMAKKELFKSKFSAAFLRMIFAFPVSRHSADLVSLKNALKVLDDGKIFGIFPEGKREITDSLDELEKGAAFLAVRSGAPVIPIYIHTKKYHLVSPVIIVGKPIDVSTVVANANKSTLIEVMTDEMADSISSLKSELEEIF